VGVAGADGVPEGSAVDKVGHNDSTAQCLPAVCSVGLTIVQRTRRATANNAAAERARHGHGRFSYPGRRAAAAMPGQVAPNYRN